MKFCKFNVNGVLSIIAVLLVSGCASIQEAPISNQSSNIDTSAESIAFMTLKVSNQKNKSYQPNMKHTIVWEDKSADAKKYSFTVPDPVNQVDGQYNEYVVSFKVKPGKYVVRELIGLSGIFPVKGTFSIPLYKDVTIPENKIVYLGHIEATVIKRTNDEQLRAGPVIPLLDQVVVGASGGTFKIDIQDKFETDTAYVKNKFPAYSSVTVENMTLSQWEKPSESKMK